MLWQRHSVSQFRLSAPQKRPNGCPTQDTHWEAQAAASEESRCPFPLSPARRYLMRCSLGLSATVLLVAALGCYHATVETGLTPSNQTVEKSFASGWIAALSPAALRSLRPLHGLTWAPTQRRSKSRMPSAVRPHCRSATVCRYTSNTRPRAGSVRTEGASLDAPFVYGPVPASDATPGAPQGADERS